MNVELQKDELNELIDYHIESKRMCAQQEDFSAAERHRLRALELATLSTGVAQTPKPTVDVVVPASVIAGGIPAPPGPLVPLNVCGEAHHQAKHVTCALARGHDGMHSANGGMLMWDMAR